MNIDFLNVLPENFLQNLWKASSIFLVGFLFFQLLGFLVVKIFATRQSKQSRVLIRRIFTYLGLVFTLFVVFKAVGVNLSALFGAAGVIGIVLGVASQTSIGNIVSGIFLFSERSFEIGDLIKVGETMGVIHSVDLLSVKLKTMNNLLIRIPNQTLISTELTNITRFPIRRMDILLSVAYKEDLKKVKDVLVELAYKNPLCLDEPEPLVLFQAFGASGIDITYGIWFEKSNYRNLRNSIFIEIQEAFAREKIEIPFPHVSLYAGEASGPIQVKLSSDSK